MATLTTLIVLILVWLWNAFKLLVTIALLPVILPWMGFMWLLHHRHLRVVSKVVNGTELVGVFYDQACSRCTRDAYETRADVPEAKVVSMRVVELFGRSPEDFLDLVHLAAGADGAPAVREQRFQADRCPGCGQPKPADQPVCDACMTRRMHEH